MNLIPSHKAPDILAGLLTVRTAVAAELLRAADLKPIHFGPRTYLKRDDINGLVDRILLDVADALRAAGANTGGTR